MMDDLARASKEVGLEMNESKTKTMYNKFSPGGRILVGGVKLEQVDKYVYLGQLITADHTVAAEVNRRIMLGWKAFGKHHAVWDSQLPLCLK